MPDVAYPSDDPRVDRFVASLSCLQPTMRLDVARRWIEDLRPEDQAQTRRILASFLLQLAQDIADGRTDLV